MSEIRVDLATRDDDAAIRSLLRREAMPGRIRISYEREPDFALGCAITGDDARVLVARSERGEVVGVACRSTRRVFINGVEQRIGYLGQLRVDERFRGRWLVARGFSLLARIDAEDPLPLYLMSIVEGNDVATGVLVDKRRRSFPQVWPIADIQTFALHVPLSRVSGRGWRAAPGEGDLAAFLNREGPRRHLFPLRNVTEDIVVARRNGAIAGVAALWDQRAYKQSVVRGYSGWLRAAATFTRRLPRVGDALRTVYATLVCVENDDRAIFADLMRELMAKARERDADYVIAGFDARDPLLPVVRSIPHYLYRSRFYLASWAQGEPLHDLLDHRPVYADVATL